MPASWPEQWLGRLFGGYYARWCTQRMVNAIVYGYVFEGHVPAEAIRKVLADRPAFVGVAVPGMPSGAPGMEGGGVDKFDVISFTRSGVTQVYVAG